MNSEFTKFVKVFLLAMVAGLPLLCAPANAQRARFPDFFQVQNSVPNYSPNSSIITSPPPQLQQPPALLQQPSIYQRTLNPPAIDPFQTPTQTFPVFPTPTQTAPQPIQPYSLGNGQAFGVQPNFTSPQFAQPQYGGPQFSNGYTYQGTNSNWLPSRDWGGIQQAWRSFQQDFLPRLLERPRVRHTYIYGNNGNELGINDMELATTANVQNFLNTDQPLRVTPGFIFHFWDGPDTMAHPGFDLPAQAYSGYLSFDHLTNPNNQIGLETSFTIGYYSDFSNNSSDAIRLTGRLLGWSRLNPYTVGKFGVEYFDRIDVKLLPAFGFYMTPSPDIKFDLFFPRSKISHRIPNFNDFEAWAYVGGEYGGGNWAIERTGGMKDQADINDVRVFVGIEWMGPRRVTGFLEAGYVFERELIYGSDLTRLGLQDTFMIRSGLAF